jgi:phosphopantetheinyl transferase (holo-ACP synthase)
MVVAMGMDIANIKWIAEPSDKYDDAIAKMLLWSVCKGII